MLNSKYLHRLHLTTICHIYVYIYASKLDLTHHSVVGHFDGQVSVTVSVL